MKDRLCVYLYYVLVCAVLMDEWHAYRFSRRVAISKDRLIRGRVNVKI